MRIFSIHDDLPLFAVPATEHTYHYQSDAYDADDEKMKREFAKSIGKASLVLHKNSFTPDNDYRDLSLYENLCHDRCNQMTMPAGTK